MIPFVANRTQPSRRTTKLGRMLAATVALAFTMEAPAAGDPGAIMSAPLAARSGPRGATMFVEVPAERTGIRAENRYTDPAMWGERYHEFEIGAIGTGVAIGDYDGDGRPDVFIVSKTESCHLFRNLGDWKFEDVTERAGVADHGAAAMIWKQGAAFADVNNDGRLDLYVCRFNAPNLLYLNQGDGTFKEAAAACGLAVSDASNAAAFCDYDRDGWLDVYVQTNLLHATKRPDGQRDYLFHNNGDGTFTNVTDRAGIGGETQGHSVTWWDYDNDGWPDLYVANDFQAPDSLYHNNRDGTFTDMAAQVLPHTPFSSMGSDLGDINNDGLIDYLAADMATTTHEKDQRTMADVRARTVDMPDNAPHPPQYLYNAVFLNTGTGRCQEAAFLTGLDACDWAWTLRFEDLDNDGRLDLYVANGMHREIHNADLILRMMTAESGQERIRIARNSPVLAEPNLAFRNLGDLRFEEVGAAWGLNRKGVSFGGAFGDLDGDGDLDLVQTHYLAPASVYRNDSDSGHRVVIALRGTRSNRFGVGARVDVQTRSGVQVRQLVVTRGYESSSEPVLHFGLGDDPRLDRLAVTWPSGEVQTFTDLAVDQRYTITEQPSLVPATLPPPPPLPATQFSDVGVATGLNLASPEVPFDELAAQRLLPLRHNRCGPALAVADVDGDGAYEVVMGGTPAQPARVLRRVASGHYEAAASLPVTPDAALNDGPLLLFDANGDGAVDLLLTKGGSALPVGAPEYQPRLLLNADGGRFEPAPEGALPALPISVGAAVAADFDRDGRLDVFLGGRVSPTEYPTAPQSALWVNRGGRFEDVTASVAPGLADVGMVTCALWTDVDGDGWPDLLLTLEWGTVTYFHNDQGKRLENWSERAGFAAAGAGWWSSLAAGDFNGDGRMDYVAGNLGLNTRYRATMDHPVLLYYGDFNDGGTPVLLEAYYEGDRLYPRRSRRELAAVIPSIKRRFPQNDAYARATLTEIVGAEKLSGALRLAATNLSSGVFLSRPDGTFSFEPLPRMAQIAPLDGMAVADFDGDGHTDIYALQNSYAMNPANGRCDGGLSQLLRGDGRGHFAAAPPAGSGLVVPGDARALVATDLDDDGWPDLIASRSNLSALVFRNGGVASGRSMQVRLRGPAGNPTAVGARVTLRLQDGSTQTSEITDGSSYFSQGPATCFFGWPKTNPPRVLRVRWPSGATTEHPVPAGEALVTIGAPDS